ncbi:Phosphorus acquisition-controlling protein [Neofusicoccum parvum]|nr:Phosphorus acquisition-controlling protein [Neofusicoccum parvum]
MSQSAQHSQWSQQLDNMAAQQDFDSLLDFGDIDLDIPFYDSTQSHEDGDRQLSALADSLDSQHLPSSGVVQPQGQNNGSASQHQQPLQDSASDFFDFSFQPQYSHNHQSGHHQQSFSTPQDHSMQPRAFVPPTPNSVEMHGDAARYLNQLDPQTRAILEQRYQLRKEDLLHTTGFPGRDTSRLFIPNAARVHAAVGIKPTYLNHTQRIPL